MMLFGIALFVGSLLVATIWSAVRGSDRKRRRRSDRPYAL